MNRRYDRETYFEIAKKIRERVPNVTITSDFIAGFPGETEEQFVETLTAMEELCLDYSNTAAYSPREKTVAARWVDKFIDEDTKFERLSRLNEQNRRCCLESNKKFVGSTMEILVEGFENHKGKNVITGRTRNNKIVHVPSDKDLTGEFLNVKIVDCKTWYLNGEIIDKRIQASTIKISVPIWNAVAMFWLNLLLSYFLADFCAAIALDILEILSPSLSFGNVVPKTLDSILDKRFAVGSFSNLVL